MSKAKERAQAVYPAWRNGIGDVFSQNSAYYGFIEGYHQAEKDIIEKAAKWLKNNLEGIVGGSIYIEDFLKAMKDE